MTECLALNNIVGINEGAVQSSVSELLNDLDAFIEEDVPADVPANEEVVNDDGDDNDSDSRGPVETANEEVQAKINDIRAQLRLAESGVKAKETTFKFFVEQ